MDVIYLMNIPEGIGDFLKSHHTTGNVHNR